MDRELVGREKEIARLRAALCRPEYSNVILLAPAGSGKTALIQGLMKEDSTRRYLEVDLAKMIANLGDKNEMAARLKGLFDEVEIHGRETGQEIVLFIDEFHQVVQLSDAAVEALKPLLASSGNRGIKVIAATTLLEFNQYVAPNQPLVERLQRINLAEPGKEVTMQILRGFAEKYGVAGDIPNDSIYELIYEYTNRYIPANAQPRKSILLLDAMVGYHRAMGMDFGRKLLSEVLYQSEGINVSFKVDATKIKGRLDRAVYAQDWATRTISDALQVAVADLNDKSKPMCSFLFAGSTGVGKAMPCRELIFVWDSKGQIRQKTMGELRVGDHVFNREGKPVLVTGVFPQGMMDVWEIELADGRTISCNDRHLVKWTRSGAGAGPSKWQVTTVAEMMATREAHPNWASVALPMNGPVEFPEADLPVDPYVLGAFLGDGCLTSKVLKLCTADPEIAEEVSRRLGNHGYHGHPDKKVEFTFYNGKTWGVRKLLFKTEDIFGSVPEVFGKYSYEKRIPQEYLTASLEQRWDLVHGLMDTDGGIATGENHACVYATTSKALADDVAKLFLSLGLHTYTVRQSAGRHRKRDIWYVSPRMRHSERAKLFTLSRKLAVAEAAAGRELELVRHRHLDRVDVKDVRPLGRQEEMVCIMVDDEEHLYQAGPYIVTHNTQVTKALAGALFGDDRGDGDENQSGNRNLIRMDMSEFSQPESVERFRKELTARIWERPFSIVLLDEIEKACGAVIRLLLQVLDDGRLTDAHERQVVFTNAYIVMTTNAGANVFKDMAPYIEDDTGGGEKLQDMMAQFRKAITTTQADNKFPPELLGRIDAIIPFQPLSRETIAKIVKRELSKLAREVRTKHDVALSVDGRVLTYIVEDSIDVDTDAGGARQAIGKLRNEVTTPVAAYINAHPEATRLRVVVEGQGAWESKTTLKSGARIVVSEA